MPKKPKLNDLIREARVKSGLTIKDIAEQVGVSPVSIFYWETGRVRPRERHLRSLCKTLRMPIRATLQVAAYA